MTGGALSGRGVSATCRAVAHTLPACNYTGTVLGVVSSNDQDK